MTILLSILIPSVVERLECLTNIVRKINQQIAGGPVEVLVCLENKKRTTGRKRNELIEQAQGKFVVFVDDDDTLSDDYVSQLLTHIKENPEADCIVFDVMVNIVNQKRKKLCKYGIEYKYGQNPNFYTRKPNHLMCYRKSIAESHKYKNISYKEDDEWGERACKNIKNQIRIDKVLYTYDYRHKPMSWYAKAQK